MLEITKWILDHWSVNTVRYGTKVPVAAMDQAVARQDTNHLAVFKVS